MLAGVLELQIFAGIAQLSTDLKRAEQQVQASTDKMGRNVATLESAFGKLGSTLSLGLAFEAVRRLSDDYVKLTAQVRIATHSQAEYANGLAEVRRISTESQASITATGALYTRLTNSLGVYGATQKQVANITETVSLGLKAYGATSVEASSAMLQLSQAFASNRLGGDEFRAMMESMPNMMRTLATSMGVPFEALKVLSAEGKITAKEMMKAWDDPALIASLQKQANMTRTITGEITVLRNNITMLVGELMQTSNGTQGITAVLHAMSDIVLALAKHIDSLATYATITAALFAGKWLLAKQAAIRVSVAMREATAMEAASEAALAKVALAASEQKAAAKQLEIYASREAFITTQAETKALLAGTLAADARTAAEARLAGLIATVNAAEGEAISEERALALARAASTAAAEARAAAEIGALAKVANFAKGLVGGTLGIIGLALWGAYEIADHLGWIDKVFNRAKYNMDALKGLAGDSPIFAKAFAFMEKGMAEYEANLKRVAAMKELGVTVSVNATPTEMIAAIDKALRDLDHAIIWGQTNRLEAAMQLKLLRKGLEEPLTPALSVAAKQIDHDLLFVTKRYDELLAKFEKGDIVQWQLTEGIKKMYEELSPKAEKTSSAVNSWNKRLAEQAAALAGVAEEGRKLTKSETEYNDLVIALNTTKDKQLKNAGEELMFEARQNIAKEAANILTADAVKLAEKQVEEMKKINAHGITQIDTLDKEIAAQKLHNDSIGKSAEEIAKLKTKAEELLIVKLQIEAADLEGKATDDAVAATRLANIKAEIAKMEELRGLKAAAAPLEAANKQAEEERKAQKKLWTDIDGFAHTAFDNIFDKGKNTFEEIGKVIKKSILDMLYQMTIKKWIISVSTTAMGGAAGMANAADATGGVGAGGAGSWLQAGSSVYSTLTGGFTALSTTIAQGAAHLGVALGGAETTVGNAMLANAGSIGAWGAGLAGFAAGVGIGSMIGGDKKVIGLDSTTTSAIGAAIGLAVTAGNPLGALVGGVVGGIFSAAFGSGATPALQYGPQNLQGKFTPQGFSGQLAQTVNQPGTKGGWLGGGDYGWSRTDYTALTAKQQGGLNTAFAATALAMGSLIAASGEANKSLTGWSFAINRTVQSQAEQTQLANDLALSLGNFLIPTLKQFQIEGESLATTATRMRDEFVLTSNIANLMGKDITKAFGSVGFASAAMRDNLVQLMGGLQAANTSMQSYYQNFFTTAEQNTIQVNALDLQFRQLGVSMPASRDAFKELVKAQDLSTVAGQQMFAALMGLNAAFAVVTPSADALAQAAIALAQKGSAQQIQLMQLTGDAVGALAAQRQIELAALDASLRPTQLLIYAAQDASDALAKQVAATTALTDATKAKSVSDYQAAQQAVDGLRSFAASIRTFLDSVAAGVGGYAVLRAQFLATNQAARGGNATAQSGLIGAAQAFLTSSQSHAMSAQDVARDTAFVQNTLEATAIATETQVTVADRQLEQLRLANTWLASLDAKNAVQNQSLDYLLTAAIASSKAAADSIAAQQAAQIAAQQAAQAAATVAAATAAAAAQQAAAQQAEAAALIMLGLQNDLRLLMTTVNPAADTQSKYQSMVTDPAVRLREQIRTLGGIPQYAVGTNEVPFDMNARIHAGEEIKPRAYVDKDKAKRDETNELLKKLVAANDDMKKELVSIKGSNYRMWQIEDKWDTEGTPAVRV